jgi:hypothetical protein
VRRTTKKNPHEAETVAELKLLSRADTVLTSMKRVFPALSVVLLCARAHAADASWWATAWSSPTMVQYGVGFNGAFVLEAGNICASSTTPCILGSGGGIGANLGVLYGDATYLGVAYTLTKQDPSRLYRLATLQQGHLELRRFWETGRDIRAYVAVLAGLAGYGEEWGVDTYGPLAGLAVGAELELSERTVITASLGYRGIRFSSFQDTSGTVRSAGISHILALEIALQARSAL